MPSKAASKKSTSQVGPGEQFLDGLVRPSVFIAAALVMLLAFAIVSFGNTPDGGAQIGLALLTSVFTICATWLRRG